MPEPGTGGTGVTTGGSGGRGGSTGGAGDTGGTGGTAGTGGGIAGSGTGGSSGSGAGGEPSGPPVLRLRGASNGKVDLLFMIDNSISMADKQAILADAVPVLLQRLVTPRCVDENGAPNGATASSSGECEEGTPEFAPVEDLHVGVVTSSLGHHGSNDVCSDATGGRTPDDRAQLLGSVRSGLPGNADGFLDWQPGGDAAALAADFRAQVQGAGETGCGYESSLEAWYRFLVDPEPAESFTFSSQNATTVRGPVNEALLAQRQAFLRPDSLLAIVMLTDENDCSILDENGTQGWLVSYKGGQSVNNWRMPAATASCQTDPNSECCRPCGGFQPAGCADDAAEQCPPNLYLPIAQDSMNMRCFQQTQRFGIDLLYPTTRYASALRDSFIDPRGTGNAVPNPLFAPVDSLFPGRARDMVFFAGIVGVPWQDIATDESLEDSRKLEYLTPEELRSRGRWDMILGNPAGNVLPSDPLMIESIDPRPAGMPHPLGIPGSAIAAAGGGVMNVINGHEQVVDQQSRDDLQFACIFDLPEPIPCTATNAAGCDCNVEEYVRQSPLCQYSAPDVDGTQIKAKAYPGLRHLEVLKAAGDQGLVASICPKNVAADGDPVADADYGYNPAMAGIVERLKRGFGPSCIASELETEPSESGDQLACPVVAAHIDAAGCECDSARGQTAVDSDSDTARSALAQLRADGQCGDGPNTVPCDVWCVCEVAELEGEELETCQNDVSGPGDADGFCYVDASSSQANAAIVASCPDNARRTVRFGGASAPEATEVALLACPL